MIPCRSTFYRHLCLEDGFLSSVSLCARRRCIAFGTSTGIELHWIESGTGNSLTRWFRLPMPSDHLHFIPPRRDIDNSRKLRIISTAAYPQPSLRNTRDSYISRSRASSFWASLNFGFRARHINIPTPDHFQAIPLSDGHHILFIDPSTSKLTIGCDTPNTGSKTLIRKILLIPPEDTQMGPTVYAAASDLSSGARIAVAYGATLMLYSVPPNVLNTSYSEEKAAAHIGSPECIRTKTGQQDHWLD